MKIAFVGRGNLRNNASTLRALGLGRVLARQGHQIHIILPDDPLNRELSQEYPSLKFLFTANGVREFFSKLALLSKTSFDLVHVMNAGLNSSLVAFVARLWNRRMVLVLDSDEWISQLFPNPFRRLVVSFLERFAVATSDGVISASRYLHDVYETWGRKRVHYLPYAADLELYSGHDEQVAECRRRFAGKKTVLYMGSFQPHFDLDFLFRSAQCLVKRCPDLAFAFIGDGPRRREIEDNCRKEGLDGIHFLGFLPDNMLTAHLRAAEVLVFPIRDTVIDRSRCPGKTFQYLAARKPIVTNRVGEVANILGEEAHYFEVGSAEDMGKKILEAIENPRIPSESRVGNNGWLARSREYLQIVEQILADKE